MNDEAVQMEIQRLYETESLTDELMDEAGEMMLTWAAGQIPQLAASAPEGELPQKTRVLRRIMKLINYVVGQRQNTDLDEKRTDLRNISNMGHKLGYPADPSYYDQLASQIAGMDEVSALTQLLKPLGYNPPEPEDEPEATTPADMMGGLQTGTDQPGETDTDSNNDEHSI